MNKLNCSHISSILVMVATLMVGSSCDNTFKFLDPSNFSRWSYSQSEGLYDNLDRDSVWIPKSISAIRANSFTFYKKDLDKNDGSVLLTFMKGQGSLIVDDATVELGQIVDVRSKSKFNLRFKSTATQPSEIVIHLQSALTSQAKGEITVIRVHAFENRTPISKLLLVRQTTQANGLRYSFDASGSTDLDIRWGDNITIYSYTVVSSESKTHTFFVDRPKIDYLFPDYGLYKVSLAVRDANGSVSTLSEKSVSVTR